MMGGGRAITRRVAGAGGQADCRRPFEGWEWQDGWMNGSDRADTQAQKRMSATRHKGQCNGGVVKEYGKASWHMRGQPGEVLM